MQLINDAQRVLEPGHAHLLGAHRLPNQLQRS